MVSKCKTVLILYNNLWYAKLTGFLMAKVGLTSATLWVFWSNTEWEQMVLNIIIISNFFSLAPKKEHIYKKV